MMRKVRRFSETGQPRPKVVPYNLLGTSMSTTTHQPDSTDAISMIEQEVRSAEADRRAISRQMLAEMVHLRMGMTQGDAALLVGSDRGTHLRHGHAALLLSTSRM